MVLFLIACSISCDPCKDDPFYEFQFEEIKDSLSFYTKRSALCSIMDSVVYKNSLDKQLTFNIKWEKLHYDSNYFDESHRFDNVGCIVWTLTCKPCYDLFMTDESEGKYIRYRFFENGQILESGDISEVSYPEFSFNTMEYPLKYSSTILMRDTNIQDVYFNLEKNVVFKFKVGILKFGDYELDFSSL